MEKEHFANFAEDYYRNFTKVLLNFEKSPLYDVMAVFDAVIARGGTVWVAGNGGSAAIANHIVCDCSKGTHVPGVAPFRTVSLAANVPLLTALGNDMSYAAVFSEPLKYYLRDEDAVLLVSSSGNSANVVEACKLANERGVPTIAFVGFKGGKLAELARHVIHIQSDNYGIVEDTHMSLIHVLTQYMRTRAEQSLG